MPGMREPAIVVIIRASTASRGKKSPGVPSMTRFASAAIAALMVCLCSAAHADEGMWTFHGFPFAKANAALKTSLDQAWLDRVRSATVRLVELHRPFVSAEGLILTNHHCVEACLAEQSSKEKSFVEDGFLAKTREEEKKCQTQVADVLVGMEDITAKISAATAGKDEAAANEARKATLTQLEGRMRDADQAEVPERHAVRGRPVLALQVQALHRRAPGVRARGRHRGVRRRPGQLPVPALVPRHGLLRAYEDGKPAEAGLTSSRSTSPVPPPAKRCSSRAIPAPPTAC